MEAKNSVTGVVVSADEATLRRLGPPWQIVGESKKAPVKQAKKDDAPSGGE